MQMLAKLVSQERTKIVRYESLGRGQRSVSALFEAAMGRIDPIDFYVRGVFMVRFQAG